MGAAPARCAWLFRALCCAAPANASARWSLDDIDEVVFVRGSAETVEREGRRLILRLADKRVSAMHGRLVRDLGGWVVEDAASTNGTCVNDSRVARARLVDGDWLELGHSFFVFRAALPVDGGVVADGADRLRTQSPELQLRFAELERVAASSVSVVILGESGTGKELVARAVHRHSRRRGPFVAVNCGALATTLVQSELFGYKRGAFSGAEEDRPGLVRSADGGTLFLDEIGDLPLASQAALLRVLQEREVMPVGATRPVAVNVRIVAATHRDLERMVAEGQFRADLLARLAGWTLPLPPLRARREDLGLLIGAFLEQRAATLSRDAARAIMRHAWPLNVRELEQCVRSAVVLAEGTIDLGHLPAGMTMPAAKSPATMVSTETSPVVAARAPLTPADERRRDELVRLLNDERGNVAAVARALGKAPIQIRRWARRYGLDPAVYRE